MNKKQKKFKLRLAKTNVDEIKNVYNTYLKSFYWLIELEEGMIVKNKKKFNI